MNYFLQRIDTEEAIPRSTLSIKKSIKDCFSCTLSVFNLNFC